MKTVETKKIENDIFQTSNFSTDSLLLITLNFVVITILLPRLQTSKEVKKKEMQFSPMISSEINNIDAAGFLTRGALAMLCIGCFFALLCFPPNLLNTNELLICLSADFFVIGTAVALIDIVHYTLTE